METSCILPVDVLEEILMRLPVKDLLRWKCVCKHWYVLIGDYIFNQKHYNFHHTMYLTNCNDVPLFLDTPSQDEIQAQFYLLSKRGSDNVILDITRNFERDIPPTLANDLGLNSPYLRCTGVINGVVCFQWGRNRLALWNPATREFKDVARWPIKPYYSEEKFVVCGTKILGLGFDLQSNDFQILGLNDKHMSSSIYEFYLYSLRTDSWKRLKEAPTHIVDFHHSSADAYFNNGIYYWFASEKEIIGDNLIISFNFTTKLFKEFKLPKDWLCRENRQRKLDNREVQCQCKYMLCIGKYKQSLGLFVNRTIENPKTGGIEIWAVAKFQSDDEGIPLHWEPVVKVSQIQCYNGLYISRIRECGDFLLTIQYGNSSEEELGTLYDPSSQVFSKLRVGFCSSFTYVESLFSLFSRPGSHSTL